MRVADLRLCIVLQCWSLVIVHFFFQSLAFAVKIAWTGASFRHICRLNSIPCSVLLWAAAIIIVGSLESHTCDANSFIFVLNGDNRAGCTTYAINSSCLCFIFAFCLDWRFKLASSYFFCLILLDLAVITLENLNFPIASRVRSLNFDFLQVYFFPMSLSYSSFGSKDQCLAVSLLQDLLIRFPICY